MCHNCSCGGRTVTAAHPLCSTEEGVLLGSPVGGWGAGRTLSIALHTCLLDPVPVWRLLASPVDPTPTSHRVPLTSSSQVHSVLSCLARGLLRTVGWFSVSCHEPSSSDQLGFPLAGGVPAKGAGTPLNILESGLFKSSFSKTWHCRLWALALLHKTPANPSPAHFVLPWEPHPGRRDKE